MKNKEKHTGEEKGKATVIPAEEVARNPNPRANENIRVRTAQPDPQTQGSKEGVGSEITDGEDG